MANIKSIGGNPIVLGLDGLTEEAKAALGNGKLSSTSESILGTPDTAQWATRESTGSGAATVRSVQGASVVWNQIYPNENYSGGSSSTRTVNFDASTGVLTITNAEVPTSNKTSSTSNAFTLVSGHKYYFPQFFMEVVTSRPEIYLYSTTSSARVQDAQIFTYSGASDEAIVVRLLFRANTVVGTWTYYMQLFDLTLMFGAGNEPTTVAEFEQMFPEAYYPYSAPTLKPVQIAGIASTDANGDALDSIEWEAKTLRAAGSVADVLYSDHVDVRVGERAYQSGDESDATVRTDGTTTYYPLATPTTTPISPALPMTYRVKQGGTEAIIVPDGEVSAAPVLTIAEGESAAELVMAALACIAAPDGPIATANHAINTYLTMQGKLYKVTSTIAVGETITAGTNVSQTTVMAELIARTA